MCTGNVNLSQTSNVDKQDFNYLNLLHPGLSFGYTEIISREKTLSLWYEKAAVCIAGGSQRCLVTRVEDTECGPPRDNRWLTVDVSLA